MKNGYDTDWLVTNFVPDKADTSSVRTRRRIRDKKEFSPYVHFPENDTKQNANKTCQLANLIIVGQCIIVITEE